MTARDCWRSASNLFGKLYADKGYIGKEFAQKMKDFGLDIVTRVRKNMKKIVHSEFDRVLLRKRSASVARNQTCKRDSLNNLSSG